MTAADPPIDEERRRRFEADRLAGGDETVDAYLPGADEPTYAATLEELVAIDLEFRWKRWAEGGAGAAPDLVAYEAALGRATDGSVRARLEREQTRLKKRFGTVRHARPGARLSHYLLRECVGRGAFAEVWRATDETLRRDVAVKLARPELADDPQIVARLVREAQSAARLRHPGIVPVHEVAEWDGKPYIVSDFVEGETLAVAMRARRFAPDDAARIVLRIAEALDYAHACGVVHRDVKPGNVLLDATGSPVLTDFGLAQLRAAEIALTRHGEVVGTPAYMSPEQARGDPKDADGRTDVYSAGVVLYELLAGALPFERGSAESLIYAVVHEDPPTPRTRDAAVPPDLDTICRKAMAKEPDRRYATARAFAEDLRRYLERLPILARTAGPLERMRLAARRNPALAATIGVSVAALLLVGGIGLTRVLEERRRFREERDRANAELYRSLVTEAKAHLGAHDSEWHEKSIAALRDAAALDVPSRDVPALRDLVLACQGSFVPTFRRVERWPAERGTAVSLAVSPEEGKFSPVHPQLVAAATDAGAVWVRELPGGRVVASVSMKDARPRRVGFVRGDVLVVGCGDGSVRLLDATTLTPVGDALLRLGSVDSMALLGTFEPLIAAGREGGTIDLIKIAGRSRLELVADLPGHEGGTTALDFSPDGKRLASGGMDRVIRVWDLGGRNVAASHRVSDPPRALDFDAHGDRIAWCTWETSGWGLLTLGPPLVAQPWYGAHLSAVRDARFAGDVRVLTSSADGTLRVSSTLNGGPVAVARPEAGPIVTSVLAQATRSTHFDGICGIDGCESESVPGAFRAIASHSSGEILVWDLAEPEGRETYQTPHVTRFVPGTTRLVTGTGTIVYSRDERASRAEVPVPRVGSIAASASGALLCGRSNGSLLAWPGPGAEPMTVRAAGSSVTCVATSPDGTLYAAGDDSGGVLLVRQDDSALPQDIDFRLGKLLAIALSPRGDLIAVAARGVALRTSERVVHVLSRDARESGAAAIAGDVAAVARAGSGIELFDVRTAASIRVFEGHTGEVSALAFADAGRLLVSTGRDKSLRVTDVASGAERSVAGTSATAAIWIAVDSESGLVARGGAGWADVVDLATLTTIARLDAGSSTSGAFAAGALHVGMREGAVRTWTKSALVAARAKSSADPPLLAHDAVLLDGAHSSQVWGVATSPDGKRVATGSHDGEVKLWDATSMALLKTARFDGGLAWSVAFSPDSRSIVACVGEAAHVLDATDLRETALLSGHGKFVTGAAFHPTNGALVVATVDGSLRVFDAKDGREAGLLHDAPGALRDLTFSPDGRVLAAACGDGNVLLWPADSVRTDSSLVATEPTQRLPCGGGAAWAVGFDKAGRYIATGGEQGAMLRDAATLAVLAHFTGELKVVRSLSFDDAGRYLSAGCYNGVSVTWDLPALRGILGPLGLDWEPDGIREGRPSSK